MKIVTSITLLAMLFVLVLAGTLSGAFGVEENLVQNGKIEGNVASATHRNGQQINVSASTSNSYTSTESKVNLTTEGVEIASKYNVSSNPNDAQLLDNFYYDTESSNNLTMQWYTYRSWGTTYNDGFGFEDKKGSDIAYVYWLEFKFDAKIIGALKTVGVSFYAKARGGFTNGTNDEKSFAVNYIGTHSSPTEALVGTNRSGNNASWDSSADGVLAEKSGWDDTEGTVYELGDKKYNSRYKIASTATGIRLIFAAISDGDLAGGFRDISCVLYLGNESVPITVSPSGAGTISNTALSGYSKLEDTKTVNFSTANKPYYFDNWSYNDQNNTPHTTNANSLAVHTYYNSVTANFKEIPFVFNGTTYTNYNDEVLQILQNKTEYLSSSITNFTTTITYKQGGTILSSAPTSIGVYTATISVLYGSTVRGSRTITFTIIEGDFGKLPSGTSGKWGSVTNPYVINTSVHLANLSGIVNGTQIALNTIVGSDGGSVTADDVVATDNTYANCYFVVTADINMSGVDFTPIGRDTSHYFRGLFYGGTNGYTGERVQRTITNLTINDSSLDYVGLFGYVWQNGNQYTRPTIEYITIGNSCSFIGKNCVGSVVAHGQDVTISHCYNYATVTGNDKVGGIVGYNFGATVINGTTNHGAVKGHDYVGGIAGEADWGGLTGTDDAIITNNGTVEGNNYVGGIVGYLWTTYSIVLATNQNQVVGKNYVGGIVGGLKYRNEYNNSIAYSTNTGTIGNTSSSSNVGGILGGCVDNQIDFKIENCSNNGNIDAKNASYVGGIAGALKGKVTITNCENANSIGGKENVGGLVGSIEGGAAITTSSNSGAVNGYKHLGGFVGNAKSSGGALSIEGTSTAPLVNGGKVTSTIPSGSSSANNDGGVAGFVGYLDGDSNLTISHCVNNGEILGLQFNGIAGILGYVKHGANFIYINHCKNTASVEGGINTGGIGGRLSTNSSAVNSMVISNCYNSGEILTQDYSTGSTGNSGTTGGICGYFNATSTTAAARTAVISYCYNVGNVKIIKSTGGQAFAQNDSNKGFIGGIVGNAKSNADKPDTNGKVAIEYCYVDLTSGRSILRYGIDMTTYINGTNLATVSATSYVIKKGTSITPGNSGSYLLYNVSTTTFDYPLVDGTQTTWENIVTQNINGFRLTTNVAAGDYYVSLNGVGGALLTPANPDKPDNLEVAGTSPYTVNAKYYVDNANGNIFVGTTEIVVNSKTETYKADSWTIDNPTLPSGYDVEIRYYDNAGYSGDFTYNRTNAGTYYTETLVKIGETVVGRLKDSTKVLTINKKALSMTWTPSALASPYTYNAAHQGITKVTINGFEGAESLASQLANTVFELNVTNLAGKTSCTITKKAKENLFEISNAINVGLYGIKVELANATNYTLTTETREWQIVQRELTFGNTWTDNSQKDVLDRTSANNFIYNGKLQGISKININGKLNGISTEGIFDITNTLPTQGGDGYAYKNAGTYTRIYTLKDTHNYIIADHADGIVEYKWTIAKNQLTVRNAWTSDPVNTDTDFYNFTFNGAAQGIGSFMLFAQEDTNINQAQRIRPEFLAGVHYSVAYSSDGSVNVGTYTATLSILGEHADNFEFVDSMTESYVATIPAIGSTDKKIDRKGVSVTTNAITYSWKINRFDVGNAFESGKVWFGAGTDMVVANQNTVNTENVNGTEFAYYYLQAAAGDSPKVIVYQNDKYIKDKFVLYVQYTTKTNGVEAHRLVKLVYGTDYTIADLTTAGDKHVADATVTASGTGNFVGDAVKYYVVADSDFGGNVNQANWGSESNPYVIEHESQLLRLSQIVNGGMAWNSINGADGLVANTGAQATNRTYEGCYFVVKANVTLLQSSASGIEGFEPIGSAAYQFKAAQFAKGDGLDSVSIEYSFSDTAREYVGLFGYIDGTSIVGIDVVGVGTIKGNKYVGGIVGYANGGKIKQCTFSVESLSKDKVSGGDYVGGIVGYANGTAIVRDWNENTYGELMQASVSGVNYVGGIAGKWIVTNANQINGDNYILSYAANLISVVGTGSYTGGIAGKLDASGCTTDLTYLGFYTNGKAGTGSDDVMDVYGTNYVGALFGAFIGNGYHYDADNSGVRSVILVKSLEDIRANVIANGNGVGYVMGGLIGYAEKVGILIGCDWTSESMVKNGSTIAKTGVYVDAKGNTSFVGGLVGVLGENATIESVKQEVAVVGGTATISGGQYSVVNKIAINGKDFVGGLIGYIASSAGSYFGTTGTILGNSIKFYNEAEVKGANYVGGIVGGLGIVDGYANFIGSDGDDVLKNLLSATHNSKQSILGYSTLEIDPYTQNPFGKLINAASVTGSGNYVGGIFGYVGDRVSLALENAPISTAMSVEQLDTPYGYLNVYNGNKGKMTDGATTIKGASYVGGIAGWLDNQAHDLTFVVNRSYVNGTTYTGGLVGYMRAGTITSSFAVAPEDVTTATNTYIGTTYIGGLVGYVDHGTISGSMSTGFLFGNVNANNGGIIGNGISPTIENSWTIYVAKDATYSTVSANDRGKYLLLDSSVENVPSLLQIVRMTGLYVADMTYLGNTYTVGKLLVNVSVPSANNNKQLAFYDVSGSDNVTDNMSVDGSGNVTATNFTKFGNFNDTDPNALTIEWAFGNANSFSVCTVAIEFVNIPNYKDKEYNQNTDEGKKNAQDAYREPSASKLYVADVTNAEYWWYPDNNPQKGANNEGQIKKLTAVIYFKYQNTLIKVGETGNYRIGDYNKEYSNDSIGSKENPIIISTQAQWNEFAYSIYTGAKTYSGQYIKLTTDITINNSSHADTNGNNLDFGAVASVPANGTTAPDNLAYNFAGNVHYDNGDKSFQGNFDGNGHTITINYVSGGYYRISVFPNAKNATFKNLTVDGQIMAASQMNGARGVYVTAAYDVAGFVGKPFGNLSFVNCINKANITGLRNVAGILGYNPSGYTIQLESCVNSGNIISLEGSFTLGGETRDNKTYSYDDGWGNKAYSYGTGGIIGGVTGDLTIESCRNTGNITGGHNVGGIIGYSDGTGTGSGVKTLTIDSCANTGTITANSGNWDDGQGGYADEDDNTPRGSVSRGVRQNIFGYAGGLVGRTGEYSLLKMFASYNSGEVVTYSNISGGLVGGVGYMGQGSGEKNSVITPGKSVIAYCYNVGTVKAGGTFPKHTENWGPGQRENHGGDIVGGLAGLVGNILITDCYNAGDVYAYGITCYGGSWQLRAGGIVGQSDPVDTSQEVMFRNIYNAGTVYCRSIYNYYGTFNTVKNLRYGAAISGYCDDENNSSTRIKSQNCYTIAYAVDIRIAEQKQTLAKYINQSCAWYDERRENWCYSAGFMGFGNAKESSVVVGTTYDTYEKLTAAITSNGTVQVGANITSDTDINFGQSYESIDADLKKMSNYPSGWLYVYGCLPQLSVFALDTYNGLSMRSVNYGLNIYGEYERQEAGEKYSPYVIKDGIDLLGLQALVDLGYDFSGKYIEFANGTNNLFKSVSKTINMATDKNSYMFKYSSGTSANATSVGKSYHLFNKGAINNQGRRGDNSVIGTDYTNWLGNNHYYNQSSGGMSSNATFSTINVLPIGRKGGSNIFKGSISGKQADGTNTEVANLRIVSSDSDYAFAGLFARAESANISYISVSGSMKAYATNGNGHSIVGGIAADISGNTVIDHCNAGTTSRSLTLEAHGKNDAYSSSTVDQLHTYAGGIVGIANTSFYTGSTHVYRAGTTSVIKNCNTVYATVKSVKNNIGGVVGYASATSLDGKQNADGKNNKIEITDNVVTKAELCAFTASGTGNSDIGTKVGGVLGYSDKYIAVIISGSTVGTDSTTASVEITGENAIGGIVGAMPNAINEIKDCAVKASTLIQRGNSWGIVENVNDQSAGEGGNHGTAIGGIIGYTYHNTAENAVTTTLSGNISFAGTIKIDYATQDDAVRNVGGIFGDMASGASFATGAVINVSGAIKVADSIKTNAQNAENSGVRNIGGVAGRTRGVAFSGNFTVSVTINIPNAYYVGGFIGRNRGEVNILADDTTINIGAKLNGAHDVGGFIGNNDASTGAILYIGANEYRRTRYEKPLSIVISQEATISASGDNVGGIVGGNTSNGGATVGAIRIVKGSITNNGTVSGANAVGGIIGNNNAGLVTGGGTGSDVVKKLTIVNGGAVSGNNYIGGVIGKLNRGTIAGTFVNNGDVTGQLFVGGSIGYVAFDAVITVAGGVATEFKNGAKEDAHTASCDALTAGDTAAQGVGTVKGKAYVGGSIGIMLGKIVGNANAKVVFTSSGIVDASDVAGYLGGSIGAIAGQVDYAQFISTGELKGINAITAVGGSVGFIGAPTPLLAFKDGNTNCTAEYAIDINGALFNRVHIKNSHFESNGASLELTGTRVNEAKYNGNVQRQDHEWGGVGGAIGVITGVANGFDGGDDWKDNTYYAQGSVTAPGVYNVGGIVGFISANNITINNMLAYDIDVTGGSNVGGIIGFTKGEKTVIANAFAISTSDSTGKYTAVYTQQDGTTAAGFAGGIIGKAADDTDASTSYWVKGYKNAELAGTNVNDLKNTLGRYTAITETIGQTTIIFTKELIGGTDVAEPVYPTPYEYISAYYEEGQTHTVNGKSLTIADTFEYNEETQVTTYKDWDWYFETYYKNASSNDTKVVKTQDGTWVYEKNTWAQYSTGTVNTGWYFVYANDAAGNEGNVGTVNAKHTDKRSTQGEYTIVDRDFWKRIANAYTASEKEKGLNDPSNANYKLNSDIVLNEDEHGNKAPLVNNLYATATAATKSGYYLYIASSGESRPTAINQDDKFYIQINTVDVGNEKESAKLAKNVAVYYRSIAMGSALTYNGYNRYAPISLQKDIKSEPGITDGKVDLTKKNSYAYTTELVEPQTVAKTVGTYKSNVFVYYYDDTGTAYKVGGITQGAWKIKQRTLTFNATSVNNKTYGDKDIESKVTIQNVAPNDRDAITFVLSIKGVDTPITISDLKAGKSYFAKDYQGIEITLVTASQDGSLSGADANFIAETITDKSTYKIEFNIKFTNAKKYEISTSLAEGLSKTNYVMSNSNQNVEVKKRGIDVKIDSGNRSAFFDGKYTHGTTWTFSNIADEAFGDTWQSVLKAFSPLFVADIEKEGGGYNTYTSDLVGKNSLTYNKVTLQYDGLSTGRITFTGAGDVGNYYLRFSDYGQNDANNTSNYYIKLTDGESESYAVSKNMLNITWSRTNNGTHVYDKSTIGTITASVVADHGIENFDSFVETYFTREWGGTTKGEKEISVTSNSSTTATITFRTAVNAGTYIAKLSVNKQTHQDKINCSYKFLNGNTKDDYSTFEYKIEKRTLVVSFDYAGENGNKSTGYIYTTRHQGLNGIKVDNLITGTNGDTVGIRIVVTGENVVYQYNTQSQNVSYSGTGVKIVSNISTIDVGKYHVTATLSSNANYQLSSTTDSWEIKKYSISLSGLTSSSKIYDGIPFKPTVYINNGATTNGEAPYKDDLITVNYKATSDKFGNGFVNKGEYTVSIGKGDITAKRKNTGSDTTLNYDVTANQSAQFTITARPITVKWNPTQTFIYNGQLQGITLASAEGGGQVKLTSCDVSSAQIKGYAGGDVIHLKLDGGKVHVKDTPFAMTAAIDRVTGKNSDGSDSVAENYTLIVDTAENDGTYNIVAASLRLEYTSGGVIKEYDATVSANVSDLTFRVVSNTLATLPQSSFKITGVYLDKNVGNDKTVKVTVKCNDTSGDFEYVGADTFEIAKVGSITPKELEVKLDKLRSGKATRVYNGETWYGGENGATYSSGTRARSAVYRSGEGFIVEGFPTAEQNGTVKISAVYKEADAKRGEFDSYVNFVYVDENNVYQKGNYNSKLFKTLVFSISGACAQNYTFKVTNGTDAYSDTVGKAGQTVTVYDSRDEQNKDKRPANAGNINIEITVKSFKVEYTNTSQSYANSDNTYNTDWKPVEATKTPTGTTVTVLNGWMYENGENGAMKTYNKYTVIRGRMGSKQLSAQVSGDKGMEHNYNMSNQPILTIGYFVDKTDFEVGSIASLMIASYYWYASEHADSPDFTPIVSAGSEWVSIVTNDVYGTGAFGESNKPADAPENCNSWDEYFAYIEQKENVTVFLNEYEGNSWGYYKTTQTTTKPTYVSYRQTADFTGIVKQADIEILNNFFTTYTYGEDGAATPTQQTWGKGGTYITNFLKPSVGNVLTALGSVFVSTGDGFGGTYNGNGYVIEYLNIYGFGGATQNVGMFDKIGNGSVSGLHLRNVTISANGGNVGGIAGEILAGEASSDVTNVSFHGSITVSGSGNVGGLFGKSARNVEKAIVLGTITANGGSVAGVVGSLSGTLSSVVSLMQVDASGTVAPIANGGTVNDSTYLANAVWSKDGNGKIAYAGGNGTAKSYAELMSGSTSGYGNDKYYYAGDTPNQKGVYDVIDDVALTSIDVQNNSNPRQSMRLRDVVDVYLLMYSLSETTASGGEINGARTYTISTTSWLVGDKHGTSKNDAIVIANKQNVALLRQLRFATFVLSVDLTSYEAQSFGGAFYGTIYLNGHSNPTDWLKASFTDVTNATIVNE